ncbi:MAG TPA: cysteine dioxygenase family protein [Thermoanaerobaculia bacterium]|nr:cysteine dioxygenase family protein [Thermoanaerobaculia bacterium]
MTAATLSGCEALCQALDRAIAGQSDTHELTRRVEEALRTTVRDRALTLPDRYREPVEGCYARRLVHKSPELGYTVLAMVWGPAQGTPLHDHCGMWCVEAVLEGDIDVRQYELMESAGDRFRFEERGEIRAGVGSAGSLIPPFEYHTMANASTTDPAISLHVYGGEMIRACVYHPVEGGAAGERWYTHEQRQLSYTE